MSSFLINGRTAVFDVTTTSNAATMVTSGGSGFRITNPSANLVYVDIGSNVATLPSVSVEAISNAATVANTNGTTTVTFTSAGNVYQVGSPLTVVGFIPANINGVFNVVKSNATSVTFANPNYIFDPSPIMGIVTGDTDGGTTGFPVLPGKTAEVTTSLPAGYPQAVSIAALTISGTATIYITPGTVI